MFRRHPEQKLSVYRRSDWGDVEGGECDSSHENAKCGQCFGAIERPLDGKEVGIAHLCVCDVRRIDRRRVRFSFFMLMSRKQRAAYEKEVESPTRAIGNPTGVISKIPNRGWPAIPAMSSTRRLVEVPISVQQPVSTVMYDKGMR